MDSYLDDPIDVDKIVGDLEDLDKDLFNHQKKKNTFNDSDEDNSIEDLLNDKNDDKKRSTISLGNSTASKAVELFGVNRGGSTTTITTTTSSTLIGSSSATSTNDFKTILPLDKPVPLDKWSSSSKPSPAEAPKIPPKPPTETVLQVKKEDNSGLRQPNEGKGKRSLMNNIFGTESRAVSLKDVSSKNTGQINKNTVRFEDNISESMPNLLNNNESQGNRVAAGGFTLSSASTREPRRRAKPTYSDDLLQNLIGSISKPSEDIVQKTQEKIDVKKPVDQNDLPGWLSEEKKLPEKNSGQANTEVVAKKITAVVEESKSSATREIKEKEFSDISRLNEARLEQQASLVALQQQEHELRTAKILSEQTDQLNHVVSMQKSKIEEQERVFNSLVESQVERQANLSTQIKIQQARIDQYIQALTRQQVGATVPRSERSGCDEEDDVCDNKNLGNESLINKLEIEKQNLENIVDILRTKQEIEIKILEDSHETQMQFMRTSMEKLEQKLQNQTELLEKSYENKIEKLVQEKKQLEVYFKLQIENLKTNHAQDVKDICLRHSEQMKILQKEQAEIIENICRSKELERQTVDFIQNKKTDLDSILKQSQTICDNVQCISEKFNDKEDLVTQKRENSLKKQEEHIEKMKELLTAQQEATEDERKKLFFSAEKLEAESSKLSLEYKKNLEIQDERELRMKIREQALIREKELFLEQTKWEREHIQYVKEAWTVEQRRQLQQLSEEREKLFVEKAKMDVRSNLKSNSDDLAKAELEAALRTAREISKEAELERARWQERVSSIDAEKKKIKVKERALMEKAKELEDLTQSALAKRDEGLKALKEAHRLEKQQKDRTSQLQMQLEMIAQRENKIASEKLTLARDRLGMISQREKPERDVTSNSYNLKTHEKIQDSQIQTRFSEIVDPQLVLLKLNLDNKLDTSNQLLSDMQIID